MLTSLSSSGSAMTGVRAVKLMLPVQRCQASSSCSQACWCNVCTCCKASWPGHHSSGQEVPGVPGGDVRAWGCLDNLSIRVLVFASYESLMMQHAAPLNANEL